MAKLIDRIERLMLEISYEAGEREDGEAARLLKVAASVLAALVEALRKIG